MMQTQTAIDPSLAALLQTAQMVTPDQTPTVAAQVVQAAQQKMQPQGIMQGMPQARQDYANAVPSMMRNMQQQQMQQMVRQAMRPQPAGIEGLPAPNMQSMADGGVVGFAGDGEFGSLVPNAGAMSLDELRIEEDKRKRQEEYQRQKAANEAYRANIARQKQEEQQRAQLQFLEDSAPQVAAAVRQQIATSSPQIPEGSDRRLDIPAGGVVSPGMAQRLVDNQRVPAPRPPAPAPSPSAQSAPTGVAALAAQPKMDLSRYEKAGAEDRAATEKIIAAQEANAAAKAAYMSGRPKFEQEGIAALTKANQAREELLSKERADDAYNRQQALLDQIGRRNTSAYSQEQGRQRQRDLAASEAQRLYEQAVIKQREAEFLQGAGRFEEAKKALDDKEKILAAMQTRINQSRQTEGGIAEREFTGAVQMYEGAQNRANSIEVERLRRATASMPGETERILAEFNRRKAKDPEDAEQYMQLIERISSRGRGMDIKETSVELRALKDEEQQQLKLLETALTNAQRKPIEEKLEDINRRRRVLMGAPAGAPAAGAAPAVGTIMQGYRFKGGNPADKNNWEKV